ncbi:MAG: diguanylate cyclase [Candidatus Omnitrophica bacterium]|nr:diguanylate cyclase [Candidatus Omnitrophota bacterium]
MLQKEGAILHQLKIRIQRVLGLRNFRIFFLILGCIVLIVIRRTTGAFGFSLGYIYITLISLAGFWFGIWGGILAATVASLILIFEINIFRYWLFRDLVIVGILVRFLAYYGSGISLGLLSVMDKRLRERLKNLAYYDELTACVNFRWTMQLLENEISRSKRYAKEFTVVMIDLDFFKKINDSYGHMVGNDVLASFADIIKSVIRTADIVGRYGGEEFLLILPEANLQQALIVVERIKTKVAQSKLYSKYLHTTQEGLQVKFSAGVASYPCNGGTSAALISVVDNALYQAKRRGRDRIFIERRRWIRAQGVAGLNIEIVDEIGLKKDKPVKIVNISGHGALLCVPNEVTVDTFLCRLSLPAHDDRWEVNCRVIHRHTQQNEYYLGIFFSDIPESLQADISRLVRP